MRRVATGVAAALIGLLSSAGVARAQSGAEFSLGGGVDMPLGTFNDGFKTGFHGLAGVSFTPPASPVEGLAKYEGGEEQDDNYRHRMMVNLAAFLFIVALAAAGVWLAIQIVDMRKNQDCLLSGRRNCAPIDVKIQER